MWLLVKDRCTDALLESNRVGWAAVTLGRVTEASVLINFALSGPKPRESSQARRTVTTALSSPIFQGPFPSHRIPSHKSPPLHPIATSPLHHHLYLQPTASANLNPRLLLQKLGPSSCSTSIRIIRHAVPLSSHASLSVETCPIHASSYHKRYQFSRTPTAEHFKCI